MSGHQYMGGARMTMEQGPSPLALPKKTAISFESVGMRYATSRQFVDALDDVSIGIERSSFVTFVGPSGCGKSTLLMIAAGLRRCTSGRVLFDDAPVDGPHGQAGIAFQSDTLLEWRSALDNVLLQVELRGLRKRDYTERARQLLQSVGLADFERRRPYELSGGMRQRVAICRALVHDPPVLLMDEPFGALDALTRDQMMLDLQNLWLGSPKTVMFVTHSISEAVFLSDRVVVMTPRPGRIDSVLDIDLPRPRTLDTTSGPEFNSYVREIREIFERRGVIRDEAKPGIDKMVR
jgi:NitT/TauT family transport system ATP-binding protein